MDLPDRLSHSINSKCRHLTPFLCFCQHISNPLQISHDGEHLEGQSCCLQAIMMITLVMDGGDDKPVQGSFSVHIRGSL